MSTRLLAMQARRVRTTLLLAVALAGLAVLADTASAASLRVLPNGPATIRVDPVPPGGDDPCSVGAGDSPGGCTYEYPDGAVVRVSTAPTGAATFTGWSLLACRAVVECTLTLDHASTTLTANYTAVQVSVQVGAGTVTAPAAGLADCGPAIRCDGSAAPGTPVTITAAPTTPGDAVHWGPGL